MIFLLIGIVLILAVLGLPLFIVFGIVSLLSYHSTEIPISSMAVEIYKLSSSNFSVLVAIPLLTFSGYLMAEGKTPERLVNLGRTWLGWIPGGLAWVTILICAIFTVFTGASGVTIIALGGLLYPVLVKDGYPENFSIGLVTTCGSVGLMFFPALPLIIYSIPSGANIDQLKHAGVLPGVLIIVLLAAYSTWVALRSSWKPHPFRWKDAFVALWEAKWELPIIAIIVLAFKTGSITVNEVPVVISFYVFVKEVFIYRDVSLFRDVPRIAQQSMVLVGSIFMVFALALVFTNFLIDQKVTDHVFEWISPYVTNKWLFLLALNVFLLIVGSMMDIYSALMVVVPLLMPIARQYGVDPLHLGMIFLANLEIGYLHPPVGLNLFLSSMRFKRSLTTLYWDTLPFLVLVLIALILITYAPSLSLFLPQMMK